MLTEGRFGIWDTKGHGLGGTATFRDTPPKAEALAAYRGQRIVEGTTGVGGIVVRDEHNCWMLNDGDSYAWSSELEGWRGFDLGCAAPN